MTLRAAIAASMAYDTIMVFDGKFTDHILPDQIHKINLSFLSPHMRRENGGCAGNIAYNYKLVGGEPVPIGMVGDDFGPYMRPLPALGHRHQLPGGRQGRVHRAMFHRHRPA